MKVWRTICLFSYTLIREEIKKKKVEKTKQEMRETHKISCQ